MLAGQHRWKGVPIERTFGVSPMMAYIKGTPREQQQMLPSYVEDYVSEDNPVRVIDAFVESLDLKQLGFRHTDPTAVGHPSYDPKDKLKLYLYGYMNRIRSSRRLHVHMIIIKQSG
jgi:transposase